MPKKFTFSLENILQYRKSLQSDKQLRLHNKKVELDNEKDKLTNIKSLKEKTLQQKNTGKRLDLHKKKVYSEYINQIDDNLKEQGNAVEKSRKKVLQATEKLKEETKRKKILEKLKDKHFESYKEDLKKEEEKVNSEIALRKKYYNSL